MSILRWLDGKRVSLLVCIKSVLALLIISSILTWLIITSKQEPNLPFKATLDLSNLIRQVSNELIADDLARMKANRDPFSVAKSCDIEVSFLVKNDQTKTGGFTYHIITASDVINQGIERVQKVTLHLDFIPPHPVKTPPSNGAFYPDRAPVKTNIGTAPASDKHTSKRRQYR